MNCNTLVSVGVITYNSAQTVLETLKSIYNQGYEHLELVISDDCSNDDTVKVCCEWVKNHSKRFIRTKIITSSKNTGISANCNRLIAEIKGDWYKVIAGDDILLSDAISNYIKFADSNKCRVIVSKAKYYNGDFTNANYNEKETNNVFNLKYPENFESTQKEFNHMIFGNWICTPTVFYHTSVLKEVGKFDERFPFCDDYPYYIRVLERNIHIYFMDEFTVGYRISMSNTCRDDNKMYKMSFCRMFFEVQKEYCFKYYSGRQKRRSYALLYLKIAFEKLNLNKDTKFHRELLLFFNRLTFFIF